MGQLANHVRTARGLLLLVGLLAATVLHSLSPPAVAAESRAAGRTVNVTFHVPVSVQTNPCFPADVVNLSGDIHIVITTTADRRGGYHVKNHLNSTLTGASITTGTTYVNSETQNQEWYARAPFPATHTHTYDFLLVSQDQTPNYLLHMTVHETVNSRGVPTAIVDRYRMECQGSGTP
jgi:hypothetical protein